VKLFEREDENEDDGEFMILDLGNKEGLSTMKDCVKKGCELSRVSFLSSSVTRYEMKCVYILGKVTNNNR